MIAKRIIFFLLMGPAFWFLSCTSPKNPGEPYANQPPDTRMANVPPNDVTGKNSYFPLVTLYWIGSDPDGYVVKYRYRWKSYFSNGDSLVHDWIDTVATKVSIVFESADTLNPHLFEVKAVDNEGADDPTPARVRFFTKQALPPNTQIKTGPTPGDTVFCSEKITDTWQGIVFTYSGSDPDGEVIDFSWKVDNGLWRRWSYQTKAVVLSHDLQAPLSGGHTFYVKSRDDTYVEDPTPDSTKFTVIVPTWDKSILVVDETRDGTGAAGSPSDEQVDGFYARLIEGNHRIFTPWDFAKQGFPAISELGRHRVVLWHKDHYLVSASQVVTQANMKVLQDYLNVGGKLWLVGWDFLPHLYSDPANLPTGTTFDQTFGYNYIHIGNAKRTGKLDFIGAKGRLDYGDLEIDPTKLQATWGGKINKVYSLEPRGFAETLFLFNSSTQDPEFQDKPCGVRYIGTTYRVLFFGFPLYFMKEDQALIVAGKALVDLME